MEGGGIQAGKQAGRGAPTAQTTRGTGKCPASRNKREARREQMVKQEGGNRWRHAAEEFSRSTEGTRARAASNSLRRFRGWIFVLSSLSFWYFSQPGEDRREARGTTWRCLRTCSVCMAPSFLLFPLNGWLSVLLTRRTANRAHSDRATRLDLCGSFEKLTRHVNRERSLRNASSRDVRIGGCVLV